MARVSKLVFWPLLAILITAVYAALIIKANSDLIGGRFALFMDERITFDGVRRILHPDSFREFLRMVFQGDDQRYGRSLWNSLAIFSFLPDFFWGERAQIIAGRMTQVLFLFSTFAILIFAFIKDWMLRVLLLAALLTMPYTDYYMSMPKPEPLQLLFLAAFLYFYKKSSFGFGRHWLFLGLAFGTKIAALPAVLLFILISAFLEIRKGNNFGAGRSYACSLKFFMIGFVIAVPLFLQVLAAAYVMRWSYRWLASRYGRSPVFGNWKWLFIAVSVLLVVLAAKRPLGLWFDSTFMNTTHGADSANINLFSWIAYLFGDWMLAPQWFVLSLFTAVIILISVYGLPLLKSFFSQNQPIPISLILFACGMGLNLAIFLGAHRLWGFYLFPGTALALTGLVAVLDDRASLSGRAHVDIKHRVVRYAAYVIECLLFILIVAWWAPAAIKALDVLSNRTVQAGYRSDYVSYRQALDFLNRYSAETGKRLRVVYDPGLFPPDNKSASYEISEFWGPLDNWDLGQDVIIFRVMHRPDAALPGIDTPEYKARLMERAAYVKYVIDKGQRCRKEKCFERVDTLQNGGEILVLRKGNLTAANSNSAPGLDISRVAPTADTPPESVNGPQDITP